MRAVQVLTPTGPDGRRGPRGRRADPGPGRRAGRGAPGRHLLPRPAAQQGASTSSSPSRRSPSASTSPAPSSRAPTASTAGQRVAGVLPVRRAPPSGSPCPRSSPSRCPTPLSYDEGAALPMNYLTAQFALVERGDLREPARPSSSTAPPAGSAPRRSRSPRASAPAPSRSSPPRPRPRSPGRPAPTRWCCSTGSRTPSPELTGGRGVDVVIDVVGGDVFTDSLRCLGTQGRLLVVGFASGQGIPEVKVNRLLLNNVDVRGVGWGAYAMVRPATWASSGQALAAADGGRGDPPADRGDVRPGPRSARRWPTWRSGARSASR